MIDAAYALLARVEIDADLTLESPRGGRVRLTRGREGQLRLNCDSNATLWEVFRLARRLGVVSSFRKLKLLRSPFLQDLEIEVAERDLLRWPAGRLPKVESLRGMIEWVRAGRG